MVQPIYGLALQAAEIDLRASWINHERDSSGSTLELGGSYIKAKLRQFVEGN
jgi:hypothetical protein